MAISKGDLFVANAERRPAERLFIEVKRVARDRSWADIFVCTWAVGWSKRQKLTVEGIPPMSVRRDWNYRDLEEQENDHMDLLDERSA